MASFKYKHDIKRWILLIILVVMKDASSPCTSSVVFTRVSSRCFKTCRVTFLLTSFTKSLRYWNKNETMQKNWTCHNSQTHFKHLTYGVWYMFFSYTDKDSYENFNIVNYLFHVSHKPLWSLLLLTLQRGRWGDLMTSLGDLRLTRVIQSAYFSSQGTVVWEMLTFLGLFLKEMAFFNLRGNKFEIFRLHLKAYLVKAELSYLLHS